MGIELAPKRGIIPSMSVIDRLHRLTGEKTQKKTSPLEGSRAEEIRTLRARIEAIVNRRTEERGPVVRAEGQGGLVPLEALLPGTEETNAGGRCFCVEHVAWGSSRHGNRCIRDLTSCDMDRLALLANDDSLRSRDYREALFLDTETTGLAGGAGTVPFLVGLGWFEGETFVTRQLFARDYAEERASLMCLAELVRGYGFLVSFNGKAFDTNLLASRFIMNRLSNPLQGLPHLDLLHPSRRLFRHRLTDRRLGTLEAALLGFEREGDIPGSEIPQRYFDWLRRRDGRLMADIFLHNRLDILSLAALAAHLASLVDPAAPDEAGHLPGDRLAAARLYLDRDCHKEARLLLSPLTACPLPETAQEACRELSLINKRDGEWTAAAALWEEMVQRDSGDLFAFIELAKWHEHHRHDDRQALAWTHRAEACPDLTPGERTELAVRRKRLERKLSG